MRAMKFTGNIIDPMHKITFSGDIFVDFILGEMRWLIDIVSNLLRDRVIGGTLLGMDSSSAI
jgi:hypothetical protein